MKSDNEKKLYDLLAEILKISADSINEDISPDNTEEWDSFNGLMIATELEKRFDVHFELKEIISVKKVGDIKLNLRNHNIEI